MKRKESKNRKERKVLAVLPVRPTMNKFRVEFNFNRTKCDQMLEYKVAQILTKVAIEVFI